MYILIHILVPVVLAVSVNALIFGLGWNKKAAGEKQRVSPWLPPGWAIAVIWVLLFALLGYAHFLVRKRPLAAWAIVAFIAYALLYPFLTGGLQSDGRFYNVIALILAYATAVAVAWGSEDRKPLVALAPLLAWASYVNLVPPPVPV